MRKVIDTQSELGSSITVIVNDVEVTCKTSFHHPNQTDITPVIQVITAADVLADVNAIANDVAIYLPPSAAISDITSFGRAIDAFFSTAVYPFLAPLLPLIELPTETAEMATESMQRTFPGGEVAWIASADLVKSALPQLGKLHLWTLLNLAQVLEQRGVSFHWRTASALQRLPEVRDLGLTKPILAVVPHYRCEVWLTRCLRSLLTQTHPPDGIVVIDDGSGQPPVEIVEQFPTVTLLAAPHRVGPYRLIQQVIDDTHYWGYLFQDADDWSSSDRLQHLLQTALTTGAELVGTQELRVDDNNRLTPVSYPLDVNAAVATKPGHPLLHPTSLVTRALVQRVSGFATGLRFGGDTEFLLRAVWSATVMNIPNYSYFRRKRPDSLTTHPKTGLESPARRTLLSQLKQRALARQQAATVGEPIDLSPIATAAAVSLKHIIGPTLI